MRYFFNRLGRGLAGRDLQGSDMFSLGDACREATVYLGETLKFYPDLVQIGEEFRVEVDDGRGRVLFRLRLTAEGVQHA